MAILLPLIVPVFSLELGQEDVGATPKSTTERKAYDLMASGFGVGYNGPLIVAVALEPPAKADPEVVQQEKQAKSLQAKLESEQQQGEAEAAELNDQADALEAEQDSLEAQQAALEEQGAALGVERAELERQRGRARDPPDAEKTTRRAGRGGEADRSPHCATKRPGGGASRAARRPPRGQGSDPEPPRSGRQASTTRASRAPARPG